MKKFIICILISIMLCTTCIFMSGCSSGDENAETENVTIVEKYTKTEYDTWGSLFWDKPIYSTKYYFLIMFEEKDTEEIMIDSKTYYSYQIGDIYVYKK